MAVLRSFYDVLIVLALCPRGVNGLASKFKGGEHQKVSQPRLPSLDSLLPSATTAQIQDHGALEDLLDGDHHAWSAKGGNRLRSGSSVFVAPRDLRTGPLWVWTPPDGKITTASPIIDSHANIYFPDVSGTIVKFSRLGHILWVNKACEAEVPAVPALFGNEIFIGCGDGKVVALSNKDGSALWRAQHGNFSGHDAWSIAAADGVVIAASSDNEIAGAGSTGLAALNATNGKLLWRKQTEEHLVNIAPAIFNHYVYVNDVRGSLYKLGLFDGKLHWVQRVPNAGYSFGGLAVISGRVFVASNVLPEGANVPENLQSTPLLLANTDSQGGMLSVYDAEKGKLMWRKEFELNANSGPALGSLGPGPASPLSVVLATGANPNHPSSPTSPQYRKRRHLTAVDAETGHERWNVTFSDWHGPCAGDNNTLQCAPSSWTSPAIGGDGVVYIGGQDGMAYSIRDDNNDGLIETNTTELTSFNMSFGAQGSPAIGPTLLAMASCRGLYVFAGQQDDEDDAR